MREMTGDAMVFESLLSLYYDEIAKYFLDRKILDILDGFIVYCNAKDIFDETNIVETMEIIYNPRLMMSKSELKEKLALSDSSLYRLRVKIVSSLHKYMSKKLGDK